jgi:hypothetical protein
MKTLYIFCFNNGVSTQSDVVIGNIDLTYQEKEELAKKYIETEYDYDRANFDITEIYPVSEDNIKLLISSRK